MSSINPFDTGDPATWPALTVDWTQPDTGTQLAAMAADGRHHPYTQVTCYDCRGRAFSRYEPRCETCAGEGALPLWHWDPAITGHNPTEN